MKRQLLILGILGAAGLAAARPAAAQALPPQVQALYPREAGEVVFADLRALRGSRHYLHIKIQVLPERYRQLEQFGMILGIDFETDVHQLSWAFVGTAEAASVSLVGAAEGGFSLREVETQARRQKLTTRRSSGALVVLMGLNKAGQEFVFAFPERTLALFGHGPAVEEMLQRHAGGGPSLADNAALKAVIGEVNGKAPLWMALDNSYTVLAVKQMLPEATRLPGFETLAGRLQSTSLRFDLRDGLRGQAAVRCASGADATLLSTLVQAALTYEGYQLSEKKPELARAVKEVDVKSEGERLQLSLSIRDADFLTLLQKSSFTLNF